MGEVNKEVQLTWFLSSVICGSFSKLSPVYILTNDNIRFLDDTEVFG